MQLRSIFYLLNCTLSEVSSDDPSDIIRVIFSASTTEDVSTGSMSLQFSRCWCCNHRCSQHHYYPPSTHCTQGITSETRLIQNLQPTESNPQSACQPTDASVFLQARVQAVDGGETGQKCEEKPSGSVLQPWDGGHPSPAWDQLPGRLQRGRPEVHRAKSGGAHHPVCQHLHTTRCRPPARPHPHPAGRQHAEPPRPPAGRPAREGRSQWNDQGRGKQRCVAT